jgi:hypothetical protein
MKNSKSRFILRKYKKLRESDINMLESDIFFLDITKPTFIFTRN